MITFALLRSLLSMEQFKEFGIMALATPVYVVVIALELVFSHAKKSGYYSLRGTITNIYLMFLNMGLDILLRGGYLLVFAFFFNYKILEISNPLVYWLVLVVVQDLLYYLLHCVDHHCRLFWAVHVTHHSSEEFNFTVGFRSSVFQPVYRFIYFIPLTFLGFSGMDIMLVYSATQIYGILVHTQTVGKLGFLEHILVTPSHHRVHHGSNPEYLDRNMGMLLIIWDKIFGTFVEEVEPVKYGLTRSVDEKGPINIVFHEWKSIAEDVRKSITLTDKLKYVFNKPGWSHDDSHQTSSQLRQQSRLKS